MASFKQARVSAKVEVVLNQYNITGQVHMLPGQRLSDFINGAKNFIPVTDAKVFKRDNDHEIELSHQDLLVLNVSEIRFIFPLEASSVPSESEPDRDPSS